MNKDQKSRWLKAQEVTGFLTDFSLKEKVEILANVLIILGVSHIRDTPSHITPDNNAKIVLDDRERNGESVANALALQGLTMLLWLQEEKT